MEKMVLKSFVVNCLSYIIFLYSAFPSNLPLSDGKQANLKDNSK